MYSISSRCSLLVHTCRSPLISLYFIYFYAHILTHTEASRTLVAKYTWNLNYPNHHATFSLFLNVSQKGEVIVDQAHRGYNMADDGGGYRSVNPLFMKYTPTNGKFSGQLGYGYRWESVILSSVLATDFHWYIIILILSFWLFEFGSSFRCINNFFHHLIILFAIKLDHSKHLLMLYSKSTVAKQQQMIMKKS